MEWVSIKNKLPEIDRLLVFDAEQNRPKIAIYVGQASNDDLLWILEEDIGTNHVTVGGISHWMKLPDRPTKDR
jgi:hypothetical protein